MSRRLVLPAVISALLLLVAPGDHPYGYYTFLRWAVFLSASLIAWGARESPRQYMTVLFAAVAILFNPFVPIELTRSIWAPIDLICAGLFALALFLPHQQTPLTADDES